MLQPPLPIDDVLLTLIDALAASPRVVLHAPPGAGKTTRVPIALLETCAGRIIMLEPRRLAARAAAAWMSHTLGDVVGGTVGYRVRLDSRTGPRTRIEIVTEGVLTRMLHDDPSLDGVDVVIFDEFHERSIHADTALALALQTQSLLRPDLRLLVMSATLDVAAVVDLLDAAGRPDDGTAASGDTSTPSGDTSTPSDDTPTPSDDTSTPSDDTSTPSGDAAPTPVIRSDGRAWPVDTVYLDRRVEGHIEAAVAAVTARAHDAYEGDILVFLPGVAEIRRTADHLADAGLPPSTDVIPLYGDLAQDEQDRAIAPSVGARRKIVLATSVAETSLTIEGVRVVIDSGLMRVPRFSPRTGMTRLATVPVSHAAARQRRGRAGRTGPGVCYRMWTEADHAALLAHRPPEILEADLAPLALDLAAWGVADPSMLHWIDAPPAAAFAQARELLRELDAIDDRGTITDHGRAMSDMSAHPRIGHMLLRSRSLGCTATASDLAALLSERDILRGENGPADPDIRLRMPILRGEMRPPPGHRVDHAALHRARMEAKHWRQRLRVDRRSASDDESVPILLALAYPDRIARQRGSRGRFVMRGGGEVLADAGHVIAGEEFIVAAEVGGLGRSARVFLAAPIERAKIESTFAQHIDSAKRIEYDPATGSVRGTRVRRLGAIVLDEKMEHEPDAADIVAALLDAVRRDGVDILPWTGHATALRQRIAFLHHHDPFAWPDVSDATLAATAETWLTPWLDATRRDALTRIDMTAAMLGIVGWERRADIDRLAPTHVDVPSGSRIPIDYADAASPVLAVRLQEMFGAADTPRVADGRVPLTLHLLSPARRPVQVTRDLASFWRTTYFDVRRDLRGRYPKHYWPDDPLAAEPTRRTRPRGS